MVFNHNQSTTNMKNILVLYLAFHMTVSLSMQACQIEDNTLKCYLRTLQSTDMDSTIRTRDRNGISTAKNLHVRCSDAFFFESQLKSEHFGSLPRLEHLEIEFCKIRSIPSRAFTGLSNLKSLSIQSYNSEWTSILLDVDPKGFDKLHSLESLNLVHNNLWSLPKDALCNLPYLQRLNVSENHLLEIADLGTSNQHGCEIPLQELDISNNFLTSLPSNALQQASRLKSLLMRGNRLSIIDDNALQYLRSLEEIDFSDNQLAALPPKIFTESQPLRKLLLKNNSLTLLTPELFKGLKNLTFLDLSYNSISTHLLSPDTFQGLQSLEILDLSHNKLTKIEELTFSSLSSLQVLNLAHNQIHSISPRAFMSNTRLKILVLSHNEINQLNDETFQELGSLESLSLDNNNLEEINITSSLPSLTDLALQNNNITKIPEFIRESPNLRTIDIGDNLINTIDSKSGFRQLQNLYGLRLEGNQIESIPNDTFSKLGNKTQTSNLNVLNLARNRIKYLKPATFKGLQKLRALRLDGNQLEDINGVVSSLSKLEWFNVSSNQLEWFDYAFLPSNISWLDISANKIAELGNFYQLKASGFKLLQSIDASNNIISSLDEKAFAPVSKSIKHIRLNGNHINDIAPNTFAKLKSIEEIEMRDNQLEHLKKPALSTIFRRQEDQATPTKIYLSGNPFICDCKLEWLQDSNGNMLTKPDSNIHRRRPQHRHMNVVDLEELVCQEMNNKEKSFSKVVEVPKSNFICPYKTHCFDLCMCCDFYACDCRMQCPHGCDCAHDASWSRNIITCSARNHTAVPLLIPMDATHVYLDGNDLRHSVVQQNFLGRHRVQHIYLNKSNIISLENNTFSGLIGVRSLHLEDNMLEYIGYGNEFGSLVHLEELYLQNNQIRSIAPGAFDSLRSLRILRLDANLLTDFPIWSALPMPPESMTAISLAQNMWSCECEFLTMFNDFLESNIKSITDYDSVQCVSNNDLVIGAGDNCPPREIYSSGHQNLPRLPENLNLATILVPALVAVLMLIIGILAVCVFRQGIKNWLYNHGSVCNKSSIYGGSIEPTSDLSSSGGDSSNSNTNKLFDVYISYCAEDSDFVDTTLAPTLEHGSNVQMPSSGTNPTYKVCLQRRDFPANASFEETVVVATESSARVLVVMSKKYLQSEWHKFKVPLKRAISNQPEGKLIILFLEEIQSINDMELSQYVRSCPTIRWGAAGFLSKLRFFLPEPAFLTFQRNITLRTLKSEPSNTPVQFLPVGVDVQENMRKKKMPRLLPQNGYDHPSQNIHSDIQQNGYSSCHSDHTYHSIQDDHHIYHTLEPSLVNQEKVYHQQPFNPLLNMGLSRNCQLINELNRTSSPNEANARAVFLNKNLDLILKVDPPRNSLSPVLPAVCHAYTQSSSSGQQLLPNVATKSSNNAEEYIV